MFRHQRCLPQGVIPTKVYRASVSLFIALLLIRMIKIHVRPSVCFPNNILTILVIMIPSNATNMWMLFYVTST